MSEPGYLRIGELARRTGASPELLRAWERRYGLLRPTRSQGGFRLYTAADEERIRRMREYLARGVAAAEAARLAVDEATSEPGAETATPAVLAPEETAAAPPPLQAAARELAEALDRFDEEHAHAVLDRLLAAYRLETILRDLLVPYLHGLGERVSLAGRVPMDGEFRGGYRRRGGQELRPFGKGMSVGGVQVGPLTRQQASVDDLPQQGVAELVAVLTGHQQLLGHRLPQRTIQLPFVQAGDRDQQRMRYLPAGHCGRPQDLLGRLGHGLDAALEQVAQGRGQQGGGAGPRALQQLLGEERVAFRAGEHAVYQVDGWGGSQDRGELDGCLGPVQAGQL